MRPARLGGPAMTSGMSKPANKSELCEQKLDGPGEQVKLDGMARQVR